MTPPQPRAALSALPAYKPGKSAEVAMAEHAIDSAIKLASNENPFAPLPSVRAAIADASAAINRYPDHRATALRAALAERLGLTPEHVAVGCGSVGLLQQLLLAYAGPGDEVAYAWRTFEAYPIYTAIAGATAVTSPLRFETVDLGALSKAVTEHTRLVMITSPNNPTGTVVGHEELEALLAGVPPQTLVVLDEAYHEYITGLHAPRALELLRRHHNFAVLRTFSKAYGLAALRVGVLLGHPQVVAAVDQTLIPFAVNGLGQAAAVASLAAESELAERVAATVAERARVQRGLRQLGFSTPDAQANFVWLPARSAAAALTLKLETLGIVARPFADEGVRVTIGSPEENDRFLDAFEACVAPLALSSHWGLPAGERAVALQHVLDRIDDVDRRLVAHATTRHAGLTDPDVGGTEQWEANQVWAHLAEIGAYWLGELQKVIDAASAEAVPFGRVRTDPVRIAAIAEGRRRDVDANLLAARRNLAALRAYLAGMSTLDWRRVGRHATLGDMDVTRQLEEFHVGHAEQHLAQLDGLTA